MSILALGSIQWVNWSYTSAPTNMTAWHRKGKKNCFFPFKFYVYLCHTELLCESLDRCFPVVFPWRKPKNNFSHITIQLLLNYCQEHLFVPGLLCIYVRLDCKKKIEQFFVFVLFIYLFFFFQLWNQTKIFLNINMKVMVEDNIRFIFSVTLGFPPHKCLIFGWSFDKYTHKSSLAAVDFLAFYVCETWESVT